MAELVKPWNDGGSLSVAYDGDGDGSAIFSSDVAEGLDREMIVVFRDSGNTVAVERTVKQVGMREVFTGYDEDFITADGGTFNVLKGEQEPEAIIVENEGYYPELVDQLVARYGYNYGRIFSPMPFDGNIILTGYVNESVTGKVAYIHIGNAGSRFCIFLYSETYEETESCFCLSDSTENKGYCSVYVL